MVKEFDKRRKYFVERLNNMDGITCMLPKDAFYVFPNISGLYKRDICGQRVTNSLSLANLVLKKAKTAFVPGIYFRLRPSPQNLICNIHGKYQGGYE